MLFLVWYKCGEISSQSNWHKKLRVTGHTTPVVFQKVYREFLIMILLKSILTIIKYNISMNTENILSQTKLN